METGIVLVVFMLFLVLVIRLFAGSLDGERVESYLRKRGWKLIDRSWDPFGPGWFGERSDRIYRIVYEDEHGNLHHAHVKTSLLSGVYLTEDTIVRRKEEKPGEEDLATENERLRRRIAELEGKR